jgi:hypothetical protein
MSNLILFFHSPRKFAKMNKQFEKFIRIAAVMVLLLTAYKCTSQNDFRINTAVGLVVFCESADPDEICLSFGVVSGEIRAEYLGKCSNTLPGRIAAAARMADDAAGSYGQFLKEGQMSDSPQIQGYYAKCRAIRRQILSIMPERAFLEIRHITERFK